MQDEQKPVMEGPCAKTIEATPSVLEAAREQDETRRMEGEALKACPFCGGQPVPVCVYHPNGYAFGCPECRMKGPIYKSLSSADVPAEAIAAWNTRKRTYVVPDKTGCTAVQADVRTTHPRIRPIRSDGWQPIETAPRDGTEILATNRFDELVKIAYSTDLADYDGWIDVDGDTEVTAEPTFWMPKPASPHLRQGDQG